MVVSGKDDPNMFIYLMRTLTTSFVEIGGCTWKLQHRGSSKSNKVYSESLKVVLYLLLPLPSLDFPMPSCSHQPHHL